MGNRKIVWMAILSLCSISPFMMGQGCSTPAVDDNDNNTGGGGNNGGNSSPVTLVDTSHVCAGVSATFYPTATGRTITITCTSSNPKSDLTLMMGANTPEGGSRVYFGVVQYYGPAINVSFTNDFTLLHTLVVMDGSKTLTTDESLNTTYTLKVIQQ